MISFGVRVSPLVRETPLDGKSVAQLDFMTGSRLLNTVLTESGHTKKVA